MDFEPNHIYHIYNRGNNSQQIFFLKENYNFFLKKIQKHIIPYGDILAWCLMPNHFHLMVYVNAVDIEVIQQVTPSHLLSKKRTLNDSISILLRSYTRAINIQENRTGSLFQNRTKARCVTDVDGITSAWFETNYGTAINIQNLKEEYPQVLFDYIHWNPVNDGLVEKIEDWEFSSCRDYLGVRSGDLINKERAEEFDLTIKSD